MGDHYVPRHYLKGFSHNPPFINVFDHQEQKFIENKSSKILFQENNFYTQKTEDELAQGIENRGAPILSKIISNKPITKAEKELFCEYLTVQYKRVPAAIERTEEVAHNIKDEILSECLEHERFKDWSIEDIEKEVLKLLETDNIRVLWEMNVQGHTTPMIIDKLCKMRWTFLKSNNSDVLTNDNPFYRFPEGLNNSDFSYPISKDIVLHGTNDTGTDLEYKDMPKNWIKAFNRRIVSQTTRYTLFTKKEPWLERFLKKTNWDDSEIRVE